MPDLLRSIIFRKMFDHLCQRAIMYMQQITNGFISSNIIVAEIVNGLEKTKSHPVDIRPCR